MRGLWLQYLRGLTMRIGVAGTLPGKCNGKPNAVACRLRRCHGPCRWVFVRPQGALRRLLWMVGGTRAWARSCVTWPSWDVLVSSPKSNRSVSVVRPEGTCAAPLRARRRLRRIMVIGMSAGRSGSKAMTSGASGAYSSWGRRAGSRSSSWVCWVPGAKGPA